MIHLDTGHELDLHGEGADVLQAIINQTDNPTDAAEINKLCLCINEINGMQVRITSMLWLDRFSRSLSHILDDAGLYLKAPRIPTSACFDRQYLRDKKRGNHG